MRRRIEKIGIYHDGIAPAYTNEFKWIFIDKERNRVNEFSYKTMDPVLRHGLYLVINDEHKYNYCRYDGTPLLSEWCDRIYKFENGYSLFWKVIRDIHGEVLRFPDMQPRYMKGVIDVNGNYVIAPNYTEIRWADNKKEYWYAEKWGAKYNLYPDGRRFLLMLDGLHELQKDSKYVPTVICNNNLYGKKSENELASSKTCHIEYNDIQMIGDKDTRFVLQSEGVKPLFVIGLNPSTADENNPDSTIRRIINLAKYNKYDSFVMLNLYPQRSSNPSYLHREPYMPWIMENLRIIDQLMVKCQKTPAVLLAFGNGILLRPYLVDCLSRIIKLMDKYNAKYYHLGDFTKKQLPRHPLYTKIGKLKKIDNPMLQVMKNMTIFKHIILNR